MILYVLLQRAAVLALHSAVLAIAIPSVCPSVCLSVRLTVRHTPILARVKFTGRHRKCIVTMNYIHFGPWSLRSSVISVPFLRTEMTEDRSDRGPKWPRHFGPKDRSVHQRTDLHVTASASVRRGDDCGG